MARAELSAKIRSLPSATLSRLRTLRSPDTSGLSVSTKALSRAASTARRPRSLGSPILDHRFPQETEVFSAGTAYVVTSMLESVVKEGTAHRECA